MNPCSFSLSVSALACAIAEDKSPEEIALLSAFFVQLGDSLATIIAVGDCNCASKQNNSNIDNNDNAQYNENNILI